ncbi:hypothetical protein [Streptomyces sp. NBC_00588]|uniref:hypothetical protein n=1 Tax=Streptomyces sp. NBC_00588 TaxID=2975784 RepID=UPI002E80B203|nr:hypothetical protein [Streptomyces sp. NBC_00588]WUB41169.1 hypothetical protein OHN38_42105 [Streptomyces sp. NBC_00588]
MKKRTKAVVLAGISAAAAVTMSAGPAQAAESSMNCATTGAGGSLTLNGYYANTTESFSVRLAVTDTLADDHHVRVRLVGKGPGGTPINWAWHYNYDGYATQKVWNTTAQYSSGLADIGVQVARYEGDTYLNSCTKWGASEGI